MTKRPSPFDTNIFRQAKIHLNNYENDSNALKCIEEQTLKKLLEGSRKLHSIILNDENDISGGNVVEEKNNFMQKCLTHYFTVNGKKIQENDKILRRSFGISKRCSYCEKNTNAIHQCIQCLEFYCSTCSFVNYDSFEDKRICLSCS